MVRITHELLRSRAEHNDGCLSTLEEIALHQFEIETIELIGYACPKLKILLLQSNLIEKIENVKRLKELRYLNLALNSIATIENLEGCEKLEKLDLTCNFINTKSLIGLETLRPLYDFKELYLTGNPCTSYPHYRVFCVGAIPQLVELDGELITEKEREEAEKHYNEYRNDILSLPNEPNEPNENVEEIMSKERFAPDYNETEPYTPLTRKALFRELAEKRTGNKETTQASTGPQATKESKEKPHTGRHLQTNQPGWHFEFLDSDDIYATTVRMDIHLPRFLDTSLLDIDCQPKYVRIVAKGKTFHVNLPHEVCPDKGEAKRSTTTGHLLLTLPILCPRQKPQNCEVRPEKSEKNEKQEKESITTKDLHNIIQHKQNNFERRKALLQQSENIDNDEVPPLE